MVLQVTCTSECCELVAYVRKFCKARNIIHLYYSFLYCVVYNANNIIIGNNNNNNYNNNNNNNNNSELKEKLKLCVSCLSLGNKIVEHFCLCRDLKKN